MIVEAPMRAFDDVASINAKGGFAAPEAYSWHHTLIEARGGDYDQRVRARILRGNEQSAADYIDILKRRADFIARINTAIEPYDVLAMPTVPMVSPPIAKSEADDDEFTRVNLTMLRNPMLINLMDGCAISIPMHVANEAPAGLMLAAAGGRDGALFAHAKAVETLFQSL